jgi:hypothetical protein
MGRIDQWGLVAIKVVSEFDHRCWSIESNGERETECGRTGVGGWSSDLCPTWKEIGGARKGDRGDDNNHLRECGGHSENHTRVRQGH